MTAGGRIWHADEHIKSAGMDLAKTIESNSNRPMGARDNSAVSSRDRKERAAVICRKRPAPYGRGSEMPCGGWVRATSPG